MNGVITPSVSRGSSHRAASVTCTPPGHGAFGRGVERTGPREKEERGREYRLHGSLPRLAAFEAPVNDRRGNCWCSMKMSPPNCSGKMSSPHGDFHDEQEGSTARWARQGSPGRQDHEPGGRPGVTMSSTA